MPNVRFVEDRDQDQVLDDVEMVAVPRVGETIRFRFPDGEEQIWTVAGVEHVFDVRLRPSSETRPVGVLCRLKEWVGR